MKLNPPASSSDLDLARAVARRLHERAQRQGHPAPSGEEPAPPDTPAPPPVVPRPKPAFQPVTPAPAPLPSASEPEGFAPPDPEDRSTDAPASEATGVNLAEPEPAAQESIDLELPAAVPPTEPVPEPEPEPGPEPAEDRPLSLEPPVAEEPPPDEGEVPPVDAPVFEPPVFDPNEAEPAAAEVPPSQAPDPEDPFSPEPAEPPLDEPAAPEAAPSQEGPWAAEAEDALSELAGEPAGPSLEGLEPPAAAYEEDPGAGVEDLLGGAPEPVAPPALEPELESPFDVVGDPSTGEVAVEPDELVGSPGPSWDEVAEASMALAGAHGAMLVDNSGQVLTARGEWPEPGPDAIAGRLVSMMDRTLQEAPTRSVSAPIAGQHLTAWRIPASEGYLTVVFMGEAPLSADVRPDIDEQIRGALG